MLFYLVGDGEGEDNDYFFMFLGSIILFKICYFEGFIGVFDGYMVVLMYFDFKWSCEGFVLFFCEVMCI